MACHSHFHGVTACVKNNYICFEFPSIFLYKLSDTFFYKNIPILAKFDISDNKKCVDQNTKEEWFWWICAIPREIVQQPCILPKRYPRLLHQLFTCSSLISHSTYFDLFPLMRIVRWSLFLKGVFTCFSSCFILVKRKAIQTVLETYTCALPLQR